MLNVREVIADFVENVYAEEEEVDTRQLLKRTKRHFRDDEEFIEALYNFSMEFIVPDVANSVRAKIRAQAPYQTGPVKERLAHVFAHVGGTFHKSLLTMTRPEHLFVAAEREVRAATELRWAGFHRTIASLHPDDTCMTIECLSDEQINSVWNKSFHTEEDPN